MADLVGGRAAQWLLRGIVVLCCLVGSEAFASDVLQLLQPSDLNGWAARRFVGETRYQLVRLDGVQALRAQADGSASALYREGRVSLVRWPLLRWRWRIRDAMSGINERSRSGDDFAARIYVVAGDPLLFWETRAICYVWAGAAKAGQDWPNPYSDRVHMVALNGFGDSPGVWVQHQRDVAADFQRYFGAAPAAIEAVGVMTDTDQNGSKASAWYTDLRFEKRR
jgi:hypothetical protein